MYGKHMAVIVILLLGVLLVLAACVVFRIANPAKAPISGGNTEYTDPDAPKTIASREITAFRTGFWYRDARDESANGKYTFEIDEDRNGEWILTVSGVFQGSTTVDEATLNRVQELIDEYELVELNGWYSVTAGLAPEYSPCSMTAEYASGERLTFTCDGDPATPWYAAFWDCFIQKFINAGYAEFAPPREAVTIKNCTIDFSEGARAYSYGIITDEDGVQRFYRTEYDMEQRTLLRDDRAELDNALLEGLQNVIEECGFERLASSYDFYMKHEAEAYVDIAIGYENERRIYLQASGDEIPEEWHTMREALRAYLDPLLKME